MSVFLILFFVFLAGLFLTYTLFLFTSRASDKKRALLKERLADAIRSSAHSTDMDVQLAREELMSEIPWMNRVLIKLQVTSKLKQMIDQADSHITVMRLILFSLTAGVLAFLAVSMISASYLLMGFFAVVASRASVSSHSCETQKETQKVSPASARCTRSHEPWTFRRTRFH